MVLKKAGANWVDGESFFDRKHEIAALAERVREGTHTLLTAQRRMGKTSLVRELLRRLGESGQFETVFVDVEGAGDAADAIAEIGVASMPVRGVWRRIVARFANILRGAGIEELAVADIRVKLRAAIDAGNWPQKGDEVFEALAAQDRPVILAIDELPLLVDRLLRGEGERVSPQGSEAAGEFMGWLRKNGQAHKGRVVLILSGSVSLEPILRRAGLSAHANIFSAYELTPWDEETATDCLAALAETYDLDLPPAVRRDMCRRLRCLVPHHVQQFFDCIHERLRPAGRRAATLDDVDRAYREDLLGARGQIGLDHYETRLRATLGSGGYRIALELLTEAAVDEGFLGDDTVDRHREHFDARNEDSGDVAIAVGDVLHQLEQDGYLERRDGGYVFVSGLLEDWWRARHGRHFVPIARRGR